MVTSPRARFDVRGRFISERLSKEEAVEEEILLEDETQSRIEDSSVDTKSNLSEQELREKGRSLRVSDKVLNAKLTQIRSSKRRRAKKLEKEAERLQRKAGEFERAGNSLKATELQNQAQSLRKKANDHLAGIRELPDTKREAEIRQIVERQSTKSTTIRQNLTTEQLQRAASLQPKNFRSGGNLTSSREVRVAQRERFLASGKSKQSQKKSVSVQTQVRQESELREAPPRPISSQELSEKSRVATIKGDAPRAAGLFVGGVATGFVEGAYGFGKSVVTLANDPLGTIKSAKDSVVGILKNPSGALSSVGQSIRQNPSGAIGQAVFSYSTGTAVSKLFTKATGLPKPTKIVFGETQFTAEGTIIRGQKGTIVGQVARGETPVTIIKGKKSIKTTAQTNTYFTGTNQATDQALKTSLTTSTEVKIPGKNKPVTVTNQANIVSGDVKGKPFQLLKAKGQQPRVLFFEKPVADIQAVKTVEGVPSPVRQRTTPARLITLDEATARPKTTRATLITTGTVEGTPSGNIPGLQGAKSFRVKPIGSESQVTSRVFVGDKLRRSGVDRATRQEVLEIGIQEGLLDRPRSTIVYGNEVLVGFGKKGQAVLVPPSLPPKTVPKPKSFDTFRDTPALDALGGSSIIIQPSVPLLRPGVSVGSLLRPSRPVVETSNDLDSASASVVRPDRSPDTVFDTLPSQRPALKPNQVPRSVPRTIPETVPRTIPSTVPRTIPKTIPKSVPKTVPETVPRTAPRVLPQVLPVSGGNVFYRPRIPLFRKTRQQRMVEGYRALVKQRGVFTQVGGLSSREGALFAGASFVSGSPSATFKVESSGVFIEPEEGEGVSRGSLNRLLSQFRQPVRNRGRVARKVDGGLDKGSSIFVEKSKYRINSPGELSGITFKGITASRRNTK